MTPAPSLALLHRVEAVAREAGECVMAVYGTDFAVKAKGDASPLTLADERAEAFIVPALQALGTGWPIVAEEAAAQGRLPAVEGDFWLVDPLDGTREFVARNGEFTVNIALVLGHRPVLGVVLQPTLARLYAGLVGQGAWVSDARGRRALHGGAPAQGSSPGPELHVACSRSHADAAALQDWARSAGLGQRALRWHPVGSSLKFGLLAEGQAQVYPRLGRTMEWDTAAGHAVLSAAGGEVLTLDGLPLRYGKPGFENPHFVAWACGAQRG